MRLVAGQDWSVCFERSCWPVEEREDETRQARAHRPSSLPPFKSPNLLQNAIALFFYYSFLLTLSSQPHLKVLRPFDARKDGSSFPHLLGALLPSPPPKHHHPRSGCFEDALMDSRTS